MIQVDSNILTYNKMIAEFMGAKYTKHTGFSLLPHELWLPNYGICRHDTVELGAGRILHYHNSWDWLMPVVEKIETMPVPLDGKYRTGLSKGNEVQMGNIEISTMYDEREDFKGWDFRVHIVLGREICDNSERWPTKLTATYQAVIKFLKWYENYQKELNSK
jgi:hypothetical protein